MGFERLELVPQRFRGFDREFSDRFPAQTQLLAFLQLLRERVRRLCR